MKKKNPVAKYQRRFNVAKVFRDKKKELKKGYQKHPGKSDQSTQLGTLIAA